LPVNLSKGLELNYTISNLDKVVAFILKHQKSKTILFHGNMGVGKTTLIKALVKALGSNDDVQSPTYSLVNEYQVNNGFIYHFDLYRLNELDEIYSIGFEEYLDENNWIFIEWPELVLDFFTENALYINLELNADNSRKISIK